jgi:hypothetical protein
VDDQVESNGTTVWVHDTGGGCIGRFGKTGAEIHRTTLEQMETGRECFECWHGPMKLVDWRRFVQRMREVHAVEVAEMHKPSWIGS